MNEYVNDENVDDSTRAWLMDMNGGSKAGAAEAKKDIKPLVSRRLDLGASADDASGSLKASPGPKALKHSSTMPVKARTSSVSFDENDPPVLPSATPRTPPPARSVTPQRTPIKSDDREGGGDGKRVARNSVEDEFAEDDEFDEGEAGGLS